MNRKRIFGIIFVLIFLLILIVQNVGANDDDRLQAQLSSSNTLTVNKDSLYNYRNLYCVDENQKFEEILTETGKHEYKAVAMAEIEGRHATFTNLKDTNAEKVIKTSNANNIMAALLSRNDIFGEGYSASKTSKEYTKAQQGLYGYYNTWINETGATEFGFETSIGNETVENLDENEILSVAKTYGESYNTYRVKIYFLKYNTSDESEIANTQNIILVEIGKATADIYVSKTWWSWQHSQFELQVGDPIKINATLEIADKKSGALIEDISSIKDKYGEPIVDENGNLIDINGNDVKEIFELEYRAEDLDRGNSQQAAIVKKEEFERIYKGEPRENVDLSKYVVKNLRVLPDEYIYKVYQCEAIEYINSNGEICKYTDENKETIYTKDYKYQSKNNENVHATNATWGAGTIDSPITIQSIGTIPIRIRWEDEANRSNQRPELVNLNFYKGEGDNEEFIKTAEVQCSIPRVDGSIQENMDWSSNAGWGYSFNGAKIINPNGDEVEPGLDIYDENGNYISYRYEIDETITYPLEDLKKTLEEYGYEVDYENAIDEKITDYLSDIKRRTIRMKRPTDYVIVGVKIDWQDDNNRDGKRPEKMVVQVNDGQYYRFYPSNIGLTEKPDDFGRMAWHGQAKWWTHAKIGDQWVAQADLGTVSDYVPTDAWWDYVKNAEDGEEIPVNMRIWIRNGNGITTGNKEKGTSYSPPLLEDKRDWVDIETTSGQWQESLIILDDSNDWTYSGMHLYRYFTTGMDKQFKVVLNTGTLGDGYECENYVNYFSCATGIQMHMDKNSNYSEGVGWIPEDPNTYDQFPEEQATEILTENVGDTELIPKEEFYKKFDHYVKYDPERQKIYLETYPTTDRFGNPAEAKTFNLIHSYEPEKVQIPITKVWDDNNNAKGMRPEKIKVALYADDKDGNKVKVQEREITGDETAEKWEYTFTSYKEDGTLLDYNERLFKYRDGGTLITYTAEEEVTGDYDKISITPENITGNRDKDEGDEDEVTSGFSLTNKYVPQYIEIKGTVWEDGEASNPNNNINGKMEPKDKKLSGIKVSIYGENNKPIQLFDENYEEQENDWEETDSNGEYTLIIEQQDLKDAYVEFKYDGMTYTTVQVKAKNKDKDTSKAVENKDQRKDFDQNHSIVTAGTKAPEEWTDKEIAASTKNVIDFRKEELYSDHPDKDKDNVKIVKDINLGLFVREQPDVAISMDISKVEVEMNDEKYTYLYNIKSEDIIKENSEESAGYMQAKFQNKDTTYTYKRPVNPANVGTLGTPGNTMGIYVTYEISIANQSNTLTTIINSIANSYDKNYLIKYGDGDDPTERYHITYGNMDDAGTITETPLNASQISKPVDKDGYSEITLSGLGIKVTAEAENKIYIRYKVNPGANYENLKNLFNEEPPLNNAVEIYSFSIEYGENTLYAEQRKGIRTYSYWNSYWDYGKNTFYGGYDYDSDPGNAGIFCNKDLKDNTGKVVEILRSQQAESDYKIKISELSQLNEANKYLEDDTDMAPAFVLCLGDPYILSGTVWEDTDVITEDEERLGNGKREDHEKTVENVKVELFEIVTKEDEEIKVELATLYDENGKIKKDESGENKDNTVFTSENGAYEFSGVVPGKEYFARFTYGNEDTEHMTKIDGNAINARNYKSTVIEEDIVKNIIRTKYNEEGFNKKWLIEHDKDCSVAVDNMIDRLSIPNLINDNYNNGVNMTAYTKPFMVKVEIDSEGGTVVESNADGNPIDEEGNPIIITNIMDKLDFGIIERPREDLIVDKTITNFKIKLSNGLELVGGNPSDPSDPNAKIQYTKTMGFVKYDDLTDVRNQSDKQLLVEIDTELIQGARLEVTYEVSIKNNNEIDYDYGEIEDYVDFKKEIDEDIIDGYVTMKPQAEYYYFGTEQVSRTPLETTIKMIDYLSKELTFESNEDSKYKMIENLNEIEALAAEPNRIISSNTKSAIDKYGYKVLKIFDSSPEDTEITIKREETRKFEMKAYKTLTNKDKYVYDNNTEIIEIDGKTARTVKAEAVMNREYIPGDYVPSLQADENITNQQDDDSVKIIITPPTGITNNIITYTIIGLIVLIVMLVGIIFIKKKSLNK